MSELPNFPAINQTSEPTSDGMPDENANDNCVPASIAAILEYFTGQKFNGDELKDLTYGQGYRGLEDAAMFVAIAASHGVHMQQFSGTKQWITDQIHAQIKNGRAVLCYVPWDFNLDVPHAVVFMGEGAGQLKVMNPWGGIFQWRSDGEWQNRGAGFFYNVMWVFSGKTPVQEEQGLRLHDTDSFFLKHFRRVAADRIHCITTGLDIAYAILNFWIDTGGQGRLPVSAEFAIAPGVTAQVCECWIIVFDPKDKKTGLRKFDNPDFDGDCYCVKITSGKGQQIIAKALTDPLNAQVTAQLKELQTKDKEIADLQQQLADAKAANPAVDPRVADYANRLAQIETIAKIA